jgi:dTDP-4-amino-4,6-dideoxygalactose transaminase
MKSLDGTSAPEYVCRHDPLPFARPSIDEDDIAAVAEAMRSGWITTGPKVREFESAFARRIGTRHAVALNSATAALHLALDAISLGPGDEVLVPTNTFTASAEVVRYFGARPVLVDIAPDTLCIDPGAAAAAITPNTRAIMPVHIGGHPAEMGDIMALAEHQQLVVIEDAAHTLPSTYRGQEVGAIGHLAAFSFYATKTITTGEGGMLVTNDDGYADRARSMGLHGMSRDAWKRYTTNGSWRYDVIAPGFKYNMTDMAAAFGLSQLRKAERFWERRRAIAATYSQAFSELPALESPAAHPWVTHSWHLYVLRLHLDLLSIDRDTFIDEMSVRGIKTSVHFIPLHTFTYYRELYGYQIGAFPVAEREFQRIVSLPIYPAMSDADVADVIGAVTDIVKRHGVA